MRQHRAAMTAAVTAVLCSVLLASAGAAEAGSPVPAGRRVAEQGGTWGTAEEVPGAMTLNAGGRAEISSVSCATAGHCGAGGFYTDSSAHQQALAVSETSGTWGSAEEIPGTSALNAGGRAAITSVSCNAAGDCGAGGYYADSSGEQEAFVVSEADGTWGSAEEVPGLAALNLGGSPGATIVSVSCGAVGDCGAGGYYTNSHGRRQAFVVSETDGSWDSAEEVPGISALDAISPGATAISVSCASPGDCGAGGFYTDSSGGNQAYVASQGNGSWDTAEEVPGASTLNAGGHAATESVSCPPAGNCSAGGYYTNGKSAVEAFVVGETSGS